MFETKSLETLESTLSSNLKAGLTSAEAARRLEDNGPNALQEKKKKNIFLMILLQLKDPMIYILMVAVIISFALKEIADGIIILLVITLNAVIGTIQEAKAERALEALKKLSAPLTLVKRDGIIYEIKAEDLVVGDIVILEEGRVVPADIRLTEAINLKTDESSLTGESTSIEKDAAIVFSEEVGIGDQRNMVFMSSTIVYGRGEGIVVANAQGSEIGKIAKMLAETKEEMTPLQKRLADLGKILGIITIVVCVALFIVALIQRRDILEMFITSISLAVAAIPEGLPAVVTIVLAMGVQRLVKVNTIVRRLPSVETLGAVSVVCSDKTGTLTQNKMTVVKVYNNHHLGELKDFAKVDSQILINGMVLCCNASIKNNAIGDPTEIALLEYGRQYHIEKEDLEKITPRIDELPFDSVRKMMTTVHIIDGKEIMYTKGAMDSILIRATKIYDKGKVRPLTQQDVEDIRTASSKMASEALRVLGLAYKEKTGPIDESNLIFVGLVGMIDPPRPEAKAAVASFKDAGIITVMITGDHVDTAYAIATQLGITNTTDECMSGAELDLLTQEELNNIVMAKRVFARVSPTHKVMIVKAFKSHNHIVAMTGDGVNDAPSLKTADIGIAMGITGTDVAKGAADMVLSDDNFASIEKAVKEGRGIYANIKKAVLFLLSSNIGEVITMFLAIVVGFPVPLLAIHILWVNLITDSLPALALGADDVDKDIMKEKPRKANESLFAHHGMRTVILYGIFIALMTLAAFLIVPISTLMKDGTTVSLNSIINILKEEEGITNLVLMKARTFAFTTLGMSQLFHMVGMSNLKKSFVHVFKEKNIMMLIAAIVGFSLQVLVTEVDFFEKFFQTTKLEWYEWMWLLLLSSLPLVIHEIFVPIHKYMDAREERFVEKKNK